MLTVTFVYDQHGSPYRVDASGHAGWAELGRDVVCAAASTVLQSTWLGLSAVAEVPVEGVRESGFLSLTWPRESADNAALRTLIATADVTIEHLAAQYPENIRYCRSELGPAWKAGRR